MNPTMPVRHCKAVFSNPNFGGRVFIEATDKQEVLETVKGVWRSKVASVPRLIYARSLVIRGRMSPSPGDWVKLRKSVVVPSRYVGDYAFVASEGVPGTSTMDSFVLVCVPRSKGGTVALVDDNAVEEFKRKGSRMVYEDKRGDGTTVECFKLGKVCITTDGLICLGRLDRLSFIYVPQAIPNHEAIHQFFKSGFLPATSRLKTAIQRQIQDLRIGQ